MFYSILDTIKNIAIFVVICETILHLAPEKNYEKYIKPIIGFMVLGKITVAIFNFQQSDIRQQMETSIIKYEKELQQFNVSETEHQVLDVTQQIYEKLNGNIINGYIIKKAEIFRTETNSKVRIVLTKDNQTLVLDRIEISDTITEKEKELRGEISLATGIEEKYIEVVIEGENS